jgi:excisionase family DNA binding protein
MLTVKDAAARAGVSAGLVYSWVTAGLLAHHRLGMPGKRGCIRIAEGDLDAFLARQKREGRQEVPPPPAPRPRPTRLKHLHLPS